MSKSKTFEFEVDEASDLPLWVQLKNRMAFLIEQGFYAAGEQLPTVRGLASDLSINYNTVNKVYLSLAADGYIESSRGRGAFVLGLGQYGSGEVSRELDEVVDDFISTCTSMGLSLDDIGTCVSRKLGKLKFEQEHAGDTRFIDIEDIRGKSARKAGGNA